MRSHLLVFDRQAFGVDRARLLDSLVAEACVNPLIAVAADGQLKGYALARYGTSALYVGPLLCVDEQSAAILLDGILDQLTGQRVYIDLYTGFEGGARLLAERGLVKQRDLFRMSYGKPNSAGTSELVFAIAGPEIG